MAWKAALGLVVSGLLLWWVFRGEDLGGILRRLEAADPLLLLAVGVIATTAGLIEAHRWGVLLAPLGVPTTLGARWKALNIGYMATNLLPARPGEVVQPFALGRLSSVPASFSFGTIVVGRVLDLVAMLGLLLATLLAPSFPSNATVLGRPIGYAVGGTVGIVVVALACIGALLFWPSASMRIVRAVAPHRLEGKLVGSVESFLSGLSLIRQPRPLLAALFWSFVLWTWRAAAFWVAFRAFGIKEGVTAAVFTQCAVVVFIAIPAAPGFVGTLQAGVEVALHEVFGVRSSAVLSLSVGYHLAGFIPVTALGLFYAWELGLHLRSISVDAEAAVERRDAGNQPECDDPLVQEA